MSRRYSNAEKAAIVLLSMGEEAAAQAMGGMAKDEVRRIAGALSRLGRVDQATVDAVLAEFRDGLAAAHGGLTGNATTARKLLGRALGEHGARQLDGAVDFATPALTETLAGIEARTLAAFLRTEHPQTAALVLAHLEARKAGETLKLLPEGLHTEVIQRLARLGPVDPEVIHDLEESLRQELARASTHAKRDLGGAEKVAQLLNGMDRAAGEALLAKLDETQPELAEQVRALMFRFADLVKIDVRGMQELLKHVPQATLKLALRGASDALAAHFYAAMSQRAATMLKEDVAAMGKARLSEVEAAQAQVAELARKLAAEGQLRVQGQGDEYV